MTADDDIVFVAGNLRVSRAAYKDRLARAASILRSLGVGAGDCIGVALRNCPQFFELLAAASAIKAKTVPIPWRLKREEVRYLVEDSRAKCVFFDTESASQMTGLPGMSLDHYEQHLARIEPASDVDGAVTQFQMELYSSGTTGRPKAIEREMPSVSRILSSEPGGKARPTLPGFASHSCGEIMVIAPSVPP